MWNIKRWAFLLGASAVGIFTTLGVVKKPEWIIGQCVGAIFGITGLWILEKILRAVLLQPTKNKGKLLKWIILKTIFLAALVALLTGMPTIAPVGFLLGYGCVLLSWALEHWLTESYPVEKTGE